MTSQLAFLGLGNMGQAMSANLVSKGNLEKPLILWNRTYSRAADHCTRLGHSIVVESIEEAVAQANIIWLCLADEAAVLDTFGAILKMDIRGKLFLECSTISPQATNQLAETVIKAGAEFVAMPVFGEPSLAKAGLLICVPAGSPESVTRIKQYLVGVIGRAVVDFSGEDPGKASLLKNIGNVVILSTMETVAECHVFAEKTGLGVKNLQKLMEAMFPIGPHMIYSKGMSTGRYYREKPIVNIQSAQKLASKVLDLARESGTVLKSYEVAVGHLARAESHIGPDGDILGIYGAARLDSGLKYESNEV